jgi:predicted DNA-binding protein
MKTVSLKLPDNLARELERSAKRQQRGKSEIIRAALSEYLRSQKGVATTSFYDLASDLIGKFEGPPDLATNPKYMEGFGR